MGVGEKGSMKILEMGDWGLVGILYYGCLGWVLFVVCRRKK